MVLRRIRREMNLLTVVPGTSVVWNCLRSASEEARLQLPQQYSCVCDMMLREDTSGDKFEAPLKV